MWHPNMNYHWCNLHVWPYIRFLFKHHILSTSKCTTLFSFKCHEHTHTNKLPSLKKNKKKSCPHSVPKMNFLCSTKSLSIHENGFKFPCFAPHNIVLCVYNAFIAQSDFEWHWLFHAVLILVYYCRREVCSECISVIFFSPSTV